MVATTVVRFMSVPLSVGVAHGRKMQQSSATRRMHHKVPTAGRGRGSSSTSAEGGGGFGGGTWSLRKAVVCGVVCCAGLTWAKHAAVPPSAPPSELPTTPPIYRDLFHASAASRSKTSSYPLQSDPLLRPNGAPWAHQSVASLTRELAATDSARLTGISPTFTLSPLPPRLPLSLPLPLLPHHLSLPPLEEPPAPQAIPAVAGFAAFPAAAVAAAAATAGVETAPRRFDGVASPVPKPERLISLGRPVTSDVRGNLGPASVVTSEATQDWLKDR